jgi:two-component system, OmpR family, sensor kinase
VFKSLRFRFFASFIAIVLITLVTAGAGLYARLGGYQEQLTAATLRQIAAPIYYNLTLNPAGTGTVRGGARLRTDLLEYLRLQHQDTGVIVLLLDSQGSVIPEAISDDTLINEHFDVPPPPQRGPNFSQLSEQKHKTVDGQTLLFVTVPMPAAVRLQQAGIAAIVVALPPSAGPDVYKDLRQRLFFAGMIGLGAALIAGLILWASLYRPMGRVTSGIRAVAHGNYGERVPISGPSEVRALAADVNAMADSVQASQRALREFLANVSHELKTPLTSIRGFSQAMHDGTLDTPEERARAARVIEVESRRLLHLVGELLDLSRIESGQQRMDVAAVRVSELLTHVSDVFAIRAEELGMHLRTEPQRDDAVNADFDRIEQVLGNLIDNAFRHSTSGGTITVGARGGAGGFVELYVSDEGGGIAREDLPHVFDRFYRSQDETAGSGAGLGLAISREIVRAHGGEIRVESPKGGGTTFAFTLPATDARAEDGRGARAATRPLDGATNVPATES